MEKSYLSILLSFFSLFLLNAQERIKIHYTEYINIQIPVERQEQLYIDLNNNKTIWVENLSTQKLFREEEEENTSEEQGRTFTATLGRTIPDDYIITDYNNKEIELIQDLGKRVFYVKDNFIEKEWALHKESKIINDIECFKASTTFRGNDWEVWYAPSLPYPYGPWKLNGLPGLILEAKSTDGYYTFLAKKIESNYPVNEPVIPRNKILKEISFKEYLEYQDNLFNLLFLPNDRNRPEPEDIFATGREKKFEIKADLSWMD